MWDCLEGKGPLPTSSHSPSLPSTLPVPMEEAGAESPGTFLLDQQAPSLARPRAGGVRGGGMESSRIPVLQCSATCGVGAVWRPVRCSSGSDGGCAAADRPVPARRCSLRPCSAWRVGNWSKVRGPAGTEGPQNLRDKAGVGSHLLLGRAHAPWLTEGDGGGLHLPQSLNCSSHSIFIFPALGLVKNVRNLQKLNKVI